ncbi:MAG: phosphodiester glycosidase family protein [Clostridia bacterium]|nr:phosphodiester glycosidase family protein [Clostridia bacterium]
MKNAKRKWFGILYTLALTGFTVWLALDTFVISHVYGESQPVSEISPSAAENTQIDLISYRVQGTTVYVADVQLADPDAMAAVLAQDAYGRNVTETPSSMAERTGALLAVNGDYYGAREKGYVIRNGVLYRSRANSGQEDLVIDENGDFSIINESEVTAQELLEAGATQVYSFGPGLISEGEILVDENDEVGRAMASNPRTALAQVGPLHYLFVVADGRTEESEGLSLYELAQFLKTLGATTAYNLDGGGSSAMIYQGQVVNHPTSTGRRGSERSVSDIVAIF